MTEARFHTVWIPLQERFYRVAFYILEDRADALDAVQDLYVKLWKIRDSLDLVRNPGAYGALLMRNLCIDRIRKTLPDSQRKLMHLHVLQGRSYEEIAAETGLSPLNIRVQVSLARKKLKQYEVH